MRKFLGLIVLVLALTVAAAPAQAAPVYIYPGAFFTVEHVIGSQDGGGPFIVSPAQGSVFDPFVTFCLQTNEAILAGLNNIYYVKAITTWAEWEDVEPLTDQLSSHSAWIYAQYLAGNWTDLGIAGLTEAERNEAVQKAIWCLEEGNYCGSPSGIIVRNAATAANPQGLGDIRVLNVVETDVVGGLHVPTDRAAQDLMTPIPEPASMLLFGSGLAGLAGLVSRRRKK